MLRLAVPVITARRGLSPPRCTACLAQSGRRGPRGPRPPTPPDVLSVSGGFLYCFNRCYHPSRLVSVQTPWSLAAPRSPQFRFRLHQGRRGARSPSSIQEGRVVRPCLAAALRPSSPLDWLLAVEDSALHPSRAGRTTMASADFSGAFPPLPVRYRCRCGSPDSIGTAPEISQGKLCILPSVPAGCIRMTPGLPAHGRVTPLRRPCIRFLFVGSEFCHKLPSDSTSRWTPLLRLAVPVITARRGLSPPRCTTCLAHQKRPQGLTSWPLNYSFHPHQGKGDGKCWVKSHPSLPESPPAGWGWLTDVV